jgi:hypothetical protein
MPYSLNRAGDLHPRKQATSNSLHDSVAQSDLREAFQRAISQRPSNLSFAWLFLYKSLSCENIERLTGDLSASL